MLELQEAPTERMEEDATRVSCFGADSGAAGSPYSTHGRRCDAPKQAPAPELRLGAGQSPTPGARQAETSVLFRRRCFRLKRLL